MGSDSNVPHDSSDKVDVSDCDKYIQPLLECGYPWWEKQHELDKLITNMWLRMLEDGCSPEYIAEVSMIARERMWAYKEQMGGADII